MPAVVVTGARQTGKSTLAEELAPGKRRYLSLDDLDVLDAARRDPRRWWAGRPVTLDEVQREPDLLRAVKRAIDRDAHAGRFLLTGSANLLLMRQVSESLAGRASYLTLWPMTRREQRGMGALRPVGRTARRPDDDWRELLAAATPTPRTGARWRGAAASPRRRSSSTAQRSARSGSTATFVPTWSATCRTSRRSPRCPTSAG